jgi:hypothetical protein
MYQCVHCGTDIPVLLAPRPLRVRICDACSESIRVNHRPLAPSAAGNAPSDGSDDVAAAKSKRRRRPKG